MSPSSQTHSARTNLAHATLDKPKEYLDTLAAASQFAYELWHNKTAICQAFLNSYPLFRTLTKQQIEDLIQDYTLNQDYELCDEAEVMRGLRQLRNLLMLRWIWQDALGVITLEQLTDELSEFADGCIIFAKDYVYEQLTERYGVPKIRQHGKLVDDDLAIFAMGKLGAGELNLSSDIDLIFVHQDRGDTDTTGHPNAKSVDNKRFMVRLGQGIIKLLDTNTADGFVFRVDMRLRPWGDGSDLAIHLSALGKYFSQHGRDWERFAWLKARVVNAIDDDFMQNLQAIIKPFVFRYYVDYSAFAALREMKSLIQSQVSQRQDLSNVKLGAGGIRDIEFIVQAFQLIYGGRHPQLQVKPCLDAMDSLVDLNFLPADKRDDLEAAYRFLRRLEHGIQAINDQQTQRLPNDPHWQDNLATTLGFADWQGLTDCINAHRDNVTAQFEQMVTERQSAKAKLFDPEHQDTQKDAKQLDDILSDANQQKLDAFWHSKLVASLSNEARQRLDDAYPLLIKALIEHENKHQQANVALPRLLNFLEAICRRSIYLVMLVENPNATIALIPMLSASPWIAGELARHPVLLDAFLQQRYHHLPDKTELHDILQQRLLRVEPDDEESLLSVLRLFKKMQVMAVAASDVIAERPIMKVSDSLTEIAEVVLTQSLQWAFAFLIKRHGYPINKQGVPVTEADCGFAIVGYGKLGGIEMSYSSDLDLVFLHQINEQAMTTGEKPISGMKFAARLAQKLMTYLSTQTRDGRAYEIDMRLRPSGNAGMMVVSAHAFEQYQLTQAWEWEHQALVRARAICGDKHVKQSFENIRKQVLCLPRDPEQVKKQVAKMRHKMLDHLGSDAQTKQAGKVHLKQDAGGIVDIEFLAQYAVLAHAHNEPELATWSDNVRIFDTLKTTGIWSAQRCDTLTDCYLLIRAATHQLALSEEDLTVNESHWHDTRESIKAIWLEVIGQR